ncbi:hypothetical protein [Streptomyces sp. NPDC047071]|uniref:hypothetical protein n=1 Tax=Streptomyces sp. NPDC047071 TaxID=3154808 RepID=UPI003453E401
MSETTGVATAAGGELFHVRWIMPEGFFELPTEAEDIDELADKLIDLAREIQPRSTPEMQYLWAAMVGSTYDELVDAGVQYAGFVVTEVDDVRCTANVSVALADLPDEARFSPVEGTARALRALGRGEVEELSLPCGPGVSWIGSRRAAVDGSLTPSGEEEPFWTSFINVQVPLSNGTAVVLEMSTPTMEGWDVFSSMFAGVCRSLQLFDAAGNPVDSKGRPVEIADVADLADTGESAE